MKGNFVYCYKVENLSDEKSVLSEISKLEGVKNCQVVDGVLFYELTEWCNEYDILVASIEICEKYGATLIVGDDNQVDSGEDETSDSLSQDLTEDDQGLEEVLSDDDSDNVLDGEEENQDNRVIGRSFLQKLKEEPKDDETLNEKRVKLKRDIITRAGELLLSIILFVVACFIPSNSQSVFTASSVLFIIAFAVSVYEIFYFMFIAFSEKKYFDSTITVMLGLVALVLFGALKYATIISMLYSLILSITQYTKRHREIILGELYDVTLLDENKSVEKANQVLDGLDGVFCKSDKIKKVFGYFSLIIIVFSFFTLIPALKLTNYSILIVGVGIILAVFSNDIVKDGIINATVNAKYCEIEYQNFNNINLIANANALEIDASVMMDGENLNENSIGAMKEFVSLGIKSLKTNFDVDVKEEIKEQIDFADKDFKGKKLLTIGGADKMISFDENAKNTKVSSGEMSSLPLAYKIAKRCKRIKTATKVLNCISTLFILLIGALPLLKKTILFDNLLYFVIGSVSLVVVSALLNIINLKNK